MTLEKGQPNIMTHHLKIKLLHFFPTIITNPITVRGVKSSHPSLRQWRHTANLCLIAAFASCHIATAQPGISTCDLCQNHSPSPALHDVLTSSNMQFSAQPKVMERKFGQTVVTFSKESPEFWDARIYDRKTGIKGGASGILRYCQTKEALAFSLSPALIGPAIVVVRKDGTIYRWSDDQYSFIELIGETDNQWVLLTLTKNHPANYENLCTFGKVINIDLSLFRKVDGNLSPK